MKLREKILRVFYPRRCCVCDKIILSDGPLCEGCRAGAFHFPYPSPTCPICGLPEEKCGCGVWRYYEKAVFPLPYTGDARKALHEMKFRGRTDKIKPLAAEIVRAVREREMTSGIDLVTFVPMAKSSEYRRGYNQAEELAKAVAKSLGLPCRALLYKYADTETQHEQSFIRRQGNILGAYEPVEEEIEGFNGKGVLVVDDILTSGATLNEAAKTLLIFGAQRVFVAAAAGRPREKKKKATQDSEKA